MLGRESFHAVECKVGLNGQRLLAPERAVVVECGDAFGHRNEIWTAFGGYSPNEIEDGLFRRAIVPRGQRLGLVLPELLRCGAEISELVDRHSICLKGKGSEWLRLQLLYEIFVGDAERDVRQVFRTAGLWYEMLDPAYSLSVDSGSKKRPCSAIVHRKRRDRIDH